MNDSIYGFLICLLCGFSFFVGYLIKVILGNKNNLTLFSIGLAFVVLIGLVMIDLLPESISIINKWYLVLLFTFIGGLFLKVLDIIIPHHEHSGKHNHKEHISTVTCIAIALHNIIECTLIYTTSVVDVKSGLLMALGVACHNIPLSIEVNSLTSSNKKELIMTICLMLSSVIGALGFILLDISLSEYTIGIITCITLGMILYIIIFELLCEVKENIKKNSMIYGLICGVILTFIIFII